MSGTALDLVQAAVFTRLTGDSTLMTLLGTASAPYAVYDSAPNGTPFPYIDISDGEEQPFRTFGSSDGHETYKTLRIYTQDDISKVGFKAAQEIYGRVNTLLDGYALPVTGHTTVMCHLEDTFQVTEDDGVTRQIAATYRVISQ